MRLKDMQFSRWHSRDMEVKIIQIKVGCVVFGIFAILGYGKEICAILAQIRGIL